MQYVNLTPHTIKVMAGDKFTEFKPSGIVARISINVEYVKTQDDMKFYKTTYTKPRGVPEPKEGVTYIASSLVRQGLKERNDIISPAEIIRDTDGHVLGCQGFETNI